MRCNIVLFIFATCGIYAINAAKPALRSDLNLMNLLNLAVNASQDDSAHYLSCFNEYVPQFNNITAKYERDFEQCLDKANQARAGIDNATLPERRQLEGEADGACNALLNCRNNTDSLAYFSCFSNTGSEDTKIMYEISADAAETLAEVREYYHQILVQQYKCTNASERAYVEGTDRTYDALNSCLTGQPTDAPINVSNNPGLQNSSPNQNGNQPSIPGIPPIPTGIPGIFGSSTTPTPET